MEEGMRRRGRGRGVGGEREREGMRLLRVRDRGVTWGVVGVSRRLKWRMKDLLQRLGMVKQGLLLDIDYMPMCV